MDRRRWLAVTGRIINPLVPRRLQDAPPEELSHARRVAAILLFNGLLVIGLRLAENLVHWQSLFTLDPRDRVLFWLTLLVHAGCLLSFRRTGRFRTTVNAFLVWNYAVITWQAIAASGPEVDQVLQWLILVPLYAFLLLNWRWGLPWSGLALATSFWLHQAEAPALSLEHLRNYTNWFSIAAIVILCLFIYEHIHGRLLKLLEQERRRFADAADHDALTGLRNRAAFDRLLARGVEEARQLGASLAVAYIDLDDFKPINDSHGHEAGDAVLRVIARRLERHFRENDVVVRLGGDEFAVLLHPVSPPPPIRARLEQARADLAQPIAWGDEQLAITASIGAARYPGDGETPEDLVRHADAAMYRAKSAKNSVCLATDLAPIS